MDEGQTRCRGSGARSVTVDAVAELIQQYSTHVRTPEGLVYLVRTYGAARADGIWIGWLEFEPLDRRAPALRTAQETHQANRAALESWASGLEVAYFEGAFSRAEIVP